MLWFIPGVLAAIGLVPLFVLIRRLAGEARQLAAELNRLAAVRGDLQELGDRAVALRNGVQAAVADASTRFGTVFAHS